MYPIEAVIDDLVVLDGEGGLVLNCVAIYAVTPAVVISYDVALDGEAAVVGQILDEYTIRSVSYGEAPGPIDAIGVTGIEIVVRAAVEGLEIQGIAIDIGDDGVAAVVLVEEGVASCTPRSLKSSLLSVMESVELLPPS